MPAPPPPTAAAAQASSTYAGFWIRVVAAIIDGIIVGVVSSLILRTTGLTIETVTYTVGMTGGAGNLVSFALLLMYYAGMESSVKQATLGKMVFGLTVTDLQGRRISMPRAIGRYVAKILSGLLLGIGFLMVAFTQKKQGLHDMIAGTLVVRT